MKVNKEKIISFKIEEQIKIAFEELCLENCTTPSQLLRQFVHNKVKQKEGKAKLLNKIKQ